MKFKKIFLWVGIVVVAVIVASLLGRKRSITMNTCFYDRNGRPIAYTEDGTHIYLYTGEPVGHLHRDSVYSFSGKHLGWLIEGWILDNNGNCVLFIEHAGAGPAKPAKAAEPAKSAKEAKPAKGAKEAVPARPAKSSSWSLLSSQEFFRQ